VILIGPGQSGDAPMFPHLMAHLSVAPTGPVGPAPAPTGSEPTRRTRPV